MTTYSDCRGLRPLGDLAWRLALIEENKTCRENALLAYENRTIDPPMRRFLDQQSANNADLAKQIADYEDQLAALSRAKPSLTKGRKTAPKSLDALDVVQKRQLLKMTVRQVVLVKNGIVIERYQGETIVGELLERQGVRSGRWRYMDVSWLN